MLFPDVDPQWDLVRTDPRFQAIMNKLGVYVCLSLCLSRGTNLLGSVISGWNTRLAISSSSRRRLMHSPSQDG